MGIFDRFKSPEIEWPETLTYEDVVRIKENADVDLCDMLTDKVGDGEHPISAWEDLLSNVGVTVNVLRWWANWNDKKLAKVSKQLTAAKITEGVQKLEEVLNFFFLDLGRGPMFGLLCRTARKQSKELTEKVSDGLEEKLGTLVANTITEKFGSSLESLESAIQDRTNTGS